jgi:hypothetical protein
MIRIFVSSTARLFELDVVLQLIGFNPSIIIEDNQSVSGLLVVDTLKLYKPEQTKQHLNVVGKRIICASCSRPEDA